METQRVGHSLPSLAGQHLQSRDRDLSLNDLLQNTRPGRDGDRLERTIYRLTDAGRLERIDWISDLIRNPAEIFAAPRPPYSRR